MKIIRCLVFLAVVSLAGCKTMEPLHSANQTKALGNALDKASTANESALSDAKQIKRIDARSDAKREIAAENLSSARDKVILLRDWSDWLRLPRK